MRSAGFCFGAVSDVFAVEPTFVLLEAGDFSGDDGGPLWFGGLDMACVAEFELKMFAKLRMKLFFCDDRSSRVPQAFVAEDCKLPAYRVDWLS